MHNAATRTGSHVFLNEEQAIITRLYRLAPA
jgi:hypothetical protein